MGRGNHLDFILRSIFSVYFMWEWFLLFNILLEDCYDDTLNCCRGIRIFAHSLTLALQDKFCESIHNSAAFWSQVSKVIIENQNTLWSHTCSLIFVDSHRCFKFVNKDTFWNSLCHSLCFNRLYFCEKFINNHRSSTQLTEIWQF